MTARTPAQAPALTPILLRTSGRSGSTLLMQLLATSERVLFERRYPFEHRYLCHAFQLARMIRLPFADDGTWNNEMLFHGAERRVGPLPYGELDALDRDAVADAAFARLWDAYSAGLRERAGLPADAFACYAEKVPQPVAEAAVAHLGARNLFLLRDPRDEMASIKAFNAKRGYAAFNWQPDDDDLSYARKICSDRRGFLQHLVGFEASERRHFLRYEDLVARPADETRRLSDWLGVELDHGRAAGDASIRAVHMTAPDAAASVGRWRTELGPDVHALFRDELGDELDRLGYAA